MTFRRSLRSKLVYTFLGGSLITVLLFSLVIKGIINDYFTRLSEVRLQFVQEQGQREIRTNVVIFKDAFQDIFDAISTPVGALAQSGAIGDELPRSQPERSRMADMLRQVQRDTKLSMLTIVDTDGKTVLRATNPESFGDDTLMRDYENPRGPVSSIRHLIKEALAGRTIKSFETFAPEILAKENYWKDGKLVSGLKDQVAIPLKSWIVPVPPNTYEERSLTMTVTMPVRNSSGKIAGAVVAGRILNEDLSVVQHIQTVLQDHASIFLGPVRAATTLTIGRGEYKDQIATGTLLDDRTDRILSRGEYIQRAGRVGGERLMGAFEPLRNYENQVIGAVYIGRPLTFIDNITSSQQAIEADARNRTNIYIVALSIVSMILAIAIASIFSKGVTVRIDQLRKGAEVIEQGQLDYRLKIESGDEIETLSKQFNSMASKLEASYQNLEKKVEERTHELKESQEAMIQQEKMVGIGQLAAGIAHELNTPLGTIIGYAQMLREDLAQQPAASANRADVDEIIEQAGRCRDLVKNLLDFSRRSTTEKSNADINGIVRKILSLVEHDFEMKGVRLHMDLDMRLPKAKVNENEIATVILNLANNAADSMPEGGDLYVSTTCNEESDRIRIDVHDTGCGIKESDRNRVFEPFFTTKEVGKGTGLGLSICYKIVENHLGSMEFDTVTDQGTTFRVYLPVNAEVRVG